MDAYRETLARRGAYRLFKSGAAPATSHRRDPYVRSGKFAIFLLNERSLAHTDLPDMRPS